ncbi:hypothetical protein CBR_g34732 [Chara braunii]|uniref:Uncharacterized protein n=1 Tax=Chara braunii TaxID=69332 RepID=A0A388JZ25_CHABU|nr:hypothetical protein CBR_g34732 [Chara braunii]|eukprot:GBG63032.1 hypothetical protein CBR_g34732 [Chara braunii]
MEDKHRKGTLQELIETGRSAEKAFFENLQARGKILQSAKTQNTSQGTKDSQKPQKENTTNGSNKKLKRKVNQPSPNSPALSTSQDKCSKLRGPDTATEEMEADTDEGQGDNVEGTVKDAANNGKKQRGTKEGGSKEGEEMMREGDDTDIPEGSREQRKGEGKEEEDEEKTDDNMSQDSEEGDSHMGTDQDATDVTGEEDEEDSLNWLAKYVKGLEREREIEFEIRIAHKKHIFNLQNFNPTQQALSTLFPTDNQYEILKKEQELSDFFAECYGAKLAEATNQGSHTPNSWNWPKSYNNTDSQKSSKRRKGGRGNAESIPTTSSQDSGDAEDGENKPLEDKEDLDRQKEILKAQITVLGDQNRETSDMAINLQKLAGGQNAEKFTAAKLEAKSGCRKRAIIPYRWNTDHGDWEVAVNKSWALIAVVKPSKSALTNNLSGDAPMSAHILGSWKDWTEEWIGSTGDMMISDFRPYMVQYSMDAKIKEHLTWKPWKVIQAIPYGLLGGDIPAERAAVAASLAEGHGLFADKQEHLAHTLQVGARVVKIHRAEPFGSPN